MTQRRSRGRLIALGVILLAAGLQLVPVDRTNPPVEQDLGAPPDAAAVLRRSCYDCHSNETRWPWYAHLAPVSWLVARDVREGRTVLNYSTWNRYEPERRAELITESWEEVAEGEMPLVAYTWTHHDARLGPEERGVLSAWASLHGAPEDHDEGETH